MTGLDERLRRAFDAPEPVRLDEIIRRQPADRRRRVTITAAVVGLAVLGVVLGLVVANPRPARTPVAVRGRPSPVSARTTAPPSYRTTHTTDHGITVSWTLRTTAGPVGGTIHGELTVTTPNPVRGCPGTFWAVVLTSRTTGPQGGSFGGPACTQVVVPAGRHTYRLSIPLVYGSCTQSRKTATIEQPACGRAPRMPVLPAGRYSAQLAYDVSLPVPPAIMITITR